MLKFCVVLQRVALGATMSKPEGPKCTSHNEAKLLFKILKHADLNISKYIFCCLMVVDPTS